MRSARDLFLVALVVNGWFLYRQSAVLGAAVSAVEEAAHELGLLSEVLVRMEREQFRSPAAGRIARVARRRRRTALAATARLKRLVENLDSRDNVVVRVLEPFILWTPHLAVQRGRLACAVGHCGAPLAACGGRDGGAVFARQPRLRTSGRPVSRIRGRAARGSKAKPSAIPLLAEDKVVRNDIRLGGALQVIVVSGSNMSGKSTMLRTLGVNVVLAQAGRSGARAAA